MNVVEALKECEANIISLKSDLQAFCNHISSTYESALDVGKSVSTVNLSVSTSHSDRGVLRNLKDFSYLFGIMKNLVVEKLEYSFKSLSQKNYEIELLNKDFLQTKYALESELEMWRKKNDNLLSEITSDKDKANDTIKKKFSVKIEQLQEENQKLRMELDMINNANREQDIAHQKQIKSVEKKLKHESRAIQAEMQKWFESQTKTMKESSILMFNTLEKLEQKLNLKFTNSMTDDSVEYSKVRSENILQAFEMKLRYSQKLEGAFKGMKKDSTIEAEYLSARTLIKEFIKNNS